MPTRQGMNTVLKRVQEMKRDQSKSAVKITSLENEIQALRQLIEGKKKPSSPTKSKSTVTKKKAKGTPAKKIVEKKVPNKTSKKKSKKVANKTIKKKTKKSSSNKTIVIDI